jgi:hypothetical protein
VYLIIEGVCMGAEYYCENWCEYVELQKAKLNRRDAKTVEKVCPHVASIVMDSVVPRPESLYPDSSEENYNGNQTDTIRSRVDEIVEDYEDMARECAVQQVVGALDGGHTDIITISTSEMYAKLNDLIKIEG